ncbi:PIG-L deacetylase family protein [Tabrizicola sp. BL-A-41-H6]|uniref:PIG-L deacetylase family protein n=1 Tax=Tabrizicola sp. BL-A-41-H6 TaxID=3421107 RepID=UPI003D67425B
MAAKIDRHVAVFMAHPDDAEIYCGGSIRAWVRMGARVTIMVATDGSRGGVDAPEVLARLRADEARAGATALGAGLVMLGRQDGALAEDAGFLPAAAAAFRDLVPDLIVAHAPNDYHSDHRALARIAVDIASFRQPVLWADTMLGTAFTPTHYVDVTADQAAKEAAILCHQSQEPQVFVDRARVSGRYRAAQCGDDAGFAEAFRHDPIYPYADIRDLLPPAPPLRHMRDKVQP